MCKRGTRGKPNTGTVFFFSFENVFPTWVSEELVYRLLEKPSTDGRIQS